MCIPPASLQIRLIHLWEQSKEACFFIKHDRLSWLRYRSHFISETGVVLLSPCCIVDQTRDLCCLCFFTAAAECHHEEREECRLKVNVGHKWVFPPAAPLKLAKCTLETVQRLP